MKKGMLYLFIITIFSACGSSRKLSEQDFLTFKNNLQENNIEVTFEWARPLGLGNVQGIDQLLINGSDPNNINLVGNTNFFRTKNDSLQIELPYYGSHQITAPVPGSNIGISFEGIPETKTLEFNTEKQKAVLKYDFTTENDNYNMILTLFPRKTAFLSVTSDRKTAISYEGNWRILQTEDRE